MHTEDNTHIDNTMTDDQIDRIMSSDSWAHHDRLDMLHGHPLFYQVAAAVIERLRQRPGYAAALRWCLALPACKTVRPRSPFASQMHRLYKRDTGESIDAGVFEIAAHDAGLPVDIQPGCEKARVGVRRVALRPIEQRVDSQPVRWPKQVMC